MILPAAFACAAMLMGVANEPARIIQVMARVPVELCAQTHRKTNCGAVEIVQAYGLLLVAPHQLGWAEQVHIACHALQWGRWQRKRKAYLPGSREGEAQCDAVEQRSGQCSPI